MSGARCHGANPATTSLFSFFLQLSGARCHGANLATTSLFSLFLQVSGARCHGARLATTSLIFKCGRVACHCKKFNWQGCQKIMLYITQPFDVSKNAIFYLVTR